MAVLNPTAIVFQDSGQNLIGHKESGSVYEEPDGSLCWNYGYVRFHVDADDWSWHGTIIQCTRIQNSITSNKHYWEYPEYAPQHWEEIVAYDHNRRKRDQLRWGS